MDQRLVPRRRLGEVALADSLGRAHALGRVVVGAVALVTAFFYATVSHTVSGGWKDNDTSEVHSLTSDFGAIPFVMMVVVIGLQFAGYQRRLPGRAQSAVGSAVIAFVLLLVTAVEHLFSGVSGGDEAPGAAFVLMAVSLAQIIVEVVLTVGQRRRLEADDPVVPRAAVVER